MLVYHEIAPNSLDSVLKHGLKRTSRGEKGDDSTIKKTDRVLDELLPDYLRVAGVSRDNNLYAFVGDEKVIVDISTGKHIKNEDFITGSDRAVLQLDVKTDQCYVSDLDAYDLVGEYIENAANDKEIQRLAVEYWQKITPLESFTIGDIRRPEIMITYDLAPEKIKVIKQPN